MKLFKWNAVPEEKLSDTISRKFIHGEKVMLSRFSLKKGASVATHQHESEQMTYVLEGSMEFDIAGKKNLVRAGEIFCIPSNVPHSAIALEDTLEMDVFSPIRQDWLRGETGYFKK